MKVTPKTEEEVAAAGLWPKGNYDFEVAESIEKISKAGNEMIELNVALYDADGHSKRVYDYLMDTENTAYKLRHFAEAVGMLPQYQRGELKAEDLIGVTGRCKVIIKKDKNGEYPDKNSITDYIKPTTNGAEKVSAAAQAPLDDEIPF